MLQCVEFITPCGDNMTHTPTQMHPNTWCCFSTCSNSINWPLGEDDRCMRLMSWRPKVASPSTSLGSAPTLLNLALTKPCDSWYGVLTMLSKKHNETNETRPADVSVPMCWLADWKRVQWYLKPRLCWHWSGEGTERKWRCHRSGFVNWWDDLNEGKATPTFWKLVKPEQMY